MMELDDMELHRIATLLKANARPPEHEEVFALTTRIAQILQERSEARELKMMAQMGRRYWERK